MNNDIKFNQKTLLYFNPNGDLILDSPKKNHPIIIDKAKLCWLACLKAMKEKGGKITKSKMTLLDIIRDYVTSPEMK